MRAEPNQSSRQSTALGVECLHPDEYDGTLPESHRAAARYIGHADPAGAAVGADAWIRHRAVDSPEIGRGAAGGDGFVVPGAAPAGAAALGEVGVEAHGEQTAGE